MPLLLFPLALVLVVTAAVALAPVSLFLRYRRGTARRPARAWVATLNASTLAVSLVTFLGTAALASFWVPRAFTYSALGAATGSLLGLLGLWWTRWEPSPTQLHYTPPRTLVLTITLLVAGRILYGFWRAVHAWQTVPAEGSWLAASGASGSMAAGAAVLGYYFTYWAGVRRQLTRHARGGNVYIVP